MKKSNSKKISYEVNLRNDPFPFCHKYRIFVVNNHGQNWIDYVFHCDYEKAKSRLCMLALKERLRLVYSSCSIRQIQLVTENYKSNSSIEHKRKSDSIVLQSLLKQS